jgi:glycosyltransferase involved in cell wall biosynthesis
LGNAAEISKKMKAAIYNPYLDTLGGGERYTLTFAKVLADAGYSVDVEWKAASIKMTLEQRFGMNLGSINIVPDIKKGDGYDLCFWVSDGSVPIMHARQNILHFQVPFHGVKGKSLMNKMKFFRINKIVCNSRFTKNIIDKEFGVESVVLYPPVDTKSFKSKRKENIILYVGRFSKILQGKGQETLVSAFKNLFDKGFQEWKLVLAGGTEVGAGNFVEELKELAGEYPVEIIESPDFVTLKSLYGKAKIFWSASGFGQNENQTPEKMEHFGITVVEAMSAGAVPIIFNGGGHKEIVENSVNGFLWNTISELVEYTSGLIRSQKVIKEFQKDVKAGIEKYGYDTFKKKVSEVLS